MTPPNAVPLPTHTATTYLVPLREGGSLPAVLDTQDGGLFVTKFRGAGQGAKALIAELIVGGLAESLGLNVPELALIHLDTRFGKNEPDPEIQDILNASRGTNVGLRYLDSAFTFDPVAVGDLVAPEEAATVVWLDALTTNIDRTARNPNLLWWGEQPALWLIDHGAALYAHHDWEGLNEARIQSPFLPIKDHVLLPFAGDLAEADARLSPRIDAAALEAILGRIPDDLLMDAPPGRAPDFDSAASNRAAYHNYLSQRLAESRPWVQAAILAQDGLRTAPTRPLDYRR